MGFSASLLCLLQLSHSGPLIQTTTPIRKTCWGLVFSHHTVATSQYDPEATGSVRYHGIMKALLDSDYYAQYAAGRDEL